MGELFTLNGQRGSSSIAFNENARGLPILTTGHATYSQKEKSSKTASTLNTRLKKEKANTSAGGVPYTRKEFLRQ